MTLKASLAAALFAASAATAAETTLQTDRDRISYTLGADIGNSLRRMEADVDLEKVTAGLRDALTGGKLLLTEEQLAQNLQTFQTQLQQKMLAKRQAEGEKGIQEGAKFLAENKTKEGVVTLPSGLQYKVITAGDASKPKPKPSDTVTTHYRGTLINGTEFDSSYKRNEPATFPVNGVIPGWTEALQLMTVGSKWQLFIPSNLAYAERGAGADIPPNSVLIFDIELLSVAP